MIISDNHRFVFVHIPKCAGTTVKARLRAIDTTGDQFFSIVDHPQMGRVHLEHLTLAELADYFPSAFDKVCEYRSMAIVRDPMDRFVSAIFQRLREFARQRASDITPETVEAEAEKVATYLASGRSRLEIEYVHFNRQSDFLEHDDRRIVQDVFPIDRIGEAASYIQQWTGVDIGDERKNRTTQLSIRSLRPIQRMLRAPYVRLFPVEARLKIRARMMKAGFYGEVVKQQFIPPESAVNRFIRDYYARDFQIYEQALAEPVA